MTSVIGPRCFTIYIEKSLYVEALEKKENRVGALKMSHFIFIDLSSGCWKWDENGYLLYKENNECIKRYDVELIVLGTERFPNWSSIVCYIIRKMWHYSNPRWYIDPDFFICSKEWLSLQSNSLK